jgi:23S rRNA (uracil1939-C5)-methyltransferase
MTNRFTIVRLGAGGDGIVETEGGPVYVPYTLPGEEATIARTGSRGTLIALLNPSPDRTEPACRHFETCGGCALQHMGDEAYRAWKRGLVVDALRVRGLDSAVEALVPCRPATRRRAVFAVAPGGQVLGFNRAMSHDIVGIAECPVLVPAITDRLAEISDLASIIAPRRKAFRLTVTATASGLDIAATGCGEPDGSVRRQATDDVIAKGFARLSMDGEIIVEPKKPMVEFGRVPVVPPPGGFLQASAEAEEAMAGVVSGHLRKAKRIADLFAGSGAFALRLAEHSAIHAVESDAAALAALDRGARNVQGLKPVTVERRDLTRRPLLAKELKPYDGLVFDPPRAGAEEVVRQLARADVARVAAVSCNPATLARDLAILVKGGYRITRVQPIDQFLWSPHVEVVALLQKK